MQKNIKLSLILVALLSSLHAEDAKTITLETLDITSTAIKTDELKSTDAVEIYTQEDIEKAHAQNIYEFLNQQSSVITMPTFGNPFAQKLDMHGYGVENGNQNIVITINGRKINNMDMVPQLLSSISISSIQKIEIIKSSGIVIGGDGANAGVINITTKKSNDKEVSLYAGTYGAFDGSFYLGHKDEKVAISVAGESQKNDGIRYIDDNGNKDENKQTNANFSLEYTPIDELELRLGAALSRIDVIYGGSLSQAEYNQDPTQRGNGTSSGQNYDTNVFSLGASYYFSDNLSLNIDASSERKESRYDVLTTAYIYNNTANYRYDSTKTTLDYTTDALSIIVGMDSFNGQRDSISESDFGWGASYTLGSTTKDNLAGFIMSRYNFGSSSIKAGYRYEKVSYEHRDLATNLKDEHSLEGAELGYNYTFDNEKSIFVNYAHAYQAPDVDRFFATTYPPPTFAPTVGFNNFIKPMKSDSYTLGFNLLQTNNKFKISAYYVDLKDEIYFYSDPSTFTYRNTNIDKSHKYGLDIYDKFIINSDFNILLNYNYVQAIIDKEIENTDSYAGKDLPGVSDHNVKLSLGYTPNQFTTITLTHVYRSEAYAMNDFNNNFTQKQDAYNSTDISATYAKKDWEVFAKINNLFNQENGLWIQDDAIYPVNFTTTALVGFKLKY